MIEFHISLTSVKTHIQFTLHTITMYTNKQAIFAALSFNDARTERTSV